MTREDLLEEIYRHCRNAVDGRPMVVMPAEDLAGLLEGVAEDLARWSFNRGVRAAVERWYDFGDHYTALDELLIPEPEEP